MFRDKKKSVEFIVTVIITLISGTILYYAILELEHKKEFTHLLTVQNAQRLFCLEYQENTIADLQVILLSDELDSIVLKGSLASFDGGTSDFTAQMSFNALGQLYSAYLSLNFADGHEIYISLYGAHKVIIQLSVSRENTSLIEEILEISGPLLVREKFHEGKDFSGIHVLLPPQKITSNVIFTQALKTIEQNIQNFSEQRDFKLTEVNTKKSCLIQNLPEDLQILETRILSSIKKVADVVNKNR